MREKNPEVANLVILSFKFGLMPYGTYSTLPPGVYILGNIPHLGGEISANGIWGENM
jgi:hypothetical protein